MCTKQEGRQNETRRTGNRPILLVSSVTLGLQLWLAMTASARSTGRLTVQIVEKQSRQPLAARMHLRNSRRRPVHPKITGLVRHGDHFYIDGQITLELRPGQYTFDLDCGPDYRPRNGHFEIERNAEDAKTVDMHRAVNLAAEGWFAGDLLLERKSEHLPLIMRGEQLHVVPPVVTKSTTSNSSSRKSAVSKRLVARLKDQRAHGQVADVHPLAPGCLLFNLPRSPLAGSPKDAAILPDKILQHCRREGGTSMALAVTDRDFPVYLISGELDAAQVMFPSSVFDGGPDVSRARQFRRNSRARDNGRRAESIYFQALEAGFRLSPTAGTGTARNSPVPAGKSRTYVHCPDGFTSHHWWEGLQAGSVFVTNGPLLRPLVRGKPPGHVFQIADHEPIELEIGLDLTTRESVEYLEIIKNGHIEHEIRLDEFAKKGSRLPPLTFRDSGWFLIRAVTNHPTEYQRALSGPYFVENSHRPRISKRAVQFFVDWIQDELEVGDDEFEDLPTNVQEALHLADRSWRERIGQASVE